MKRNITIATALLLSLISVQARADEHRGGDAALGALSGAVVFGPIGAVAGAVVGYTAGPSIAHSWGFRRSHSAGRRTGTARAPAQAADTRGDPIGTSLAASRARATSQHLAAGQQDHAASQCLAPAAGADPRVIQAAAAQVQPQ